MLWGAIVNPPMPEALAAIQSDAMVQVSEGDWLVFQPADGAAETGYIFYPGGRVDSRAYAPYARSLAEAGYLVIIPNMPLHLAVLDANEAENVIKAYPDVQRWVLGGHSLGGAMAAGYAAQHPQQVSGLVLLASYPAASSSLVESGLPVLSIFAEHDGLATAEKIDAARPLLPANTRYIEIAGGNHAQFGWYGTQSGDGVANIAHSDQHIQTLQATLDFLQALP